MSQPIKMKRRKRRAQSVRSRIRRESTSPRLSIHRSTKHISAQVIDDEGGRTLCAVSSTAKGLASDLDGKKKTEKAAIIGTEIAKKAKEAGITKVVLDRGFAKYHGRVKALADAARKEGLEF